jgi:hypothetical protein
MYVCLTLDKTVTFVGPDGLGVWEMIPQPNLLADDSRPRQIKVLAGRN